VLWRLERTILEAELVLANAVASLLFGGCLVLLGGFLSTATLWVSFLAISVAIFSEVSLNATSALRVFG
jgi:hypothetical protein